MENTALLGWLVRGTDGTGALLPPPPPHAANAKTASATNARFLIRRLSKRPLAVPRRSGGPKVLHAPQ